MHASNAGQDYCNYHTSRPELWGMLGLTMPPAYPSHAFVRDAEATDTWLQDCIRDEPFEFETGVIVVNKKAAWSGICLRHSTLMVDLAGAA